MPSGDERYRDGTYLRQNPTWHVEDSPWKAAQVLAILRDNGLRPGTVAEVGCGAGAIVAELARRLPATTFVGFDLSEDAATFWADRRSDRVDFRLADFALVDEHYDALLCLDVFEHVENYYAFLRAIRGKADHTVFHIPLDMSVLNIVMGGIMGVRKSIGHLHYFTTESALATLGDTGYEILDWRYTTLLKADPTMAIQGRLLRRGRQAVSAVSIAWSQRLLGGNSIIVLAR